MKICVYGAGAVGGYLGFLLSSAGCEVTLVDQGPHLEAIGERGLSLGTEGEVRTREISCTADPATLPPQDVVFIAVKTYSIPAILPELPGLFHPETVVVNVNNGIPWWYFHGLGGDMAGTRLESVDPGGAQWAALGPERAIGCVVYPACRIAAPGVIEHISGNRFALGEPSGEKTERLAELSAAMREAGLKVSVKTRIRDEVWIKLWGNMAFNPISVLTGGTLSQICKAPGTRALARDMMLEARAVAECLGVRFSIDEDKRIAGAEAVGEHKTSMLQDYEAGQPLETDALLTAVQELGTLVDKPTHTIDRVLAMLKLKLATEAAAA
jgi:2-dehydropantoate 2-reductase